MALMAPRQPIVPSGGPPWILAPNPTASAPRPRYSDGVSYAALWEEKARNVLKTSTNFNDMGLVLKLFRFQNPNDAVEVLSGRWKCVLDAWLNLLHRNRCRKRLCDSETVKAKEIVNIFSQRRSTPAPVWDGEWICTAMDSRVDVTTIAEKLDSSICSVFRDISYDSWFYRDNVASNFLDKIRNFRDRCAEYLQSQDQPTDKWKREKWKLLEQASSAYR